MAVFRLQENVPDVYARKSRDFQLLCNAFDCVNNGVKYDIDSIVDILNTKQCNERLLPLLQTKLGFFSKKNFTASQLRAALMSFKQIVQDKGSETGIREAIEVFLKISNASNKSEIRQINIDKSVDDELVSTRLSDSYIITVAIESKAIDVTILTELLKYVLPAGYQLKYSFYSSVENVSIIHEQDVVNIVFVSGVGNDNNIGNNQVAAVHDEIEYLRYKGINGVSTTHAVQVGNDSYTTLIKEATGYERPIISELQQIIQIAESYKDKKDKYTESSWEAFEKSMNTATRALDEIEQSAVDSAKEALSKAIQSLVIKEDIANE